jgi:phage terminase Nu1 subunit (DNA packaging protein)
MATSFNIQAIAKLLKLSERRIQQLAKDNIIPKAERGKYDLVSSVHGYIDFLKAKAGGDFTAEEVLKNKNKLLKAKAEIAEIEKQKATGELIPKEEVKRTWLELVHKVKQKLLSIPNKVAPVIVTVKNINEIKLILQDKLYEALYEITSDDRSVAKDNESNKATTTSKNKSVGR